MKLKTKATLVESLISLQKQQRKKTESSPILFTTMTLADAGIHCSNLDSIINLKFVPEGEVGGT